jgi:2-oxoglutarate dehydrogenase E2 component (dihydrolipoamide succinyltransferase)
MSKINVILPAMGEGVIEATINKWLIPEGASVNEEDPIVEVATDKVDSEVPAPASGILLSIVAKEGSVPRVGEVIAVLETKADSKPAEPAKVEKEIARVKETIEAIKEEKSEEENLSKTMKSRTPSGRFISPLVRSIAATEGISYADLDLINGTGMDGRITRDDILKLLDRKKQTEKKLEEKSSTLSAEPKQPETKTSSPQRLSGEDEIVEMDRVGKLVAEHMILSKKTSAHVTSFIDADVTRLVLWRNSVKDLFQAKEGQKLTFTPVFIEAAARALQDFPMINVSVDGTRIIKKKNINIGMATALPDGNLIVPVIKNADEKSITGLARAVNDLAERARNNKLKPDEITGGTFTLTNFGSYDNLAGTPIINQPQVAILGTGGIRKMPAVLETPEGDVIAIRHIMILSLSYDHRVINGALAGKFLRRVKEILEDYNAEL